MTRLLTRTGSSLPLWFEDILAYSSIATANVDPIATYQASSMATSDLSTMNEYVAHGFGVKNATDNSGYIYAITFSQFESYLKQNRGILPASWSLSGIVPRQIHLAAGEWCVTPIVKVFKDNDNTYASTVVTVNIGRIL
jgi:hypothetical protein